jgi:hypothetical protein
MDDDACEKLFLEALQDMCKMEETDSQLQSVTPLLSPLLSVD